MLSDIGPMICSNLGERVADHAALAVASDDQRISFRGPQRIHHRIRRIFFYIGFGTLAFRIDEIFLRMGIAAGREDQVMSKIAETYEQQVEEGISSLVSIIEPTMVAALSIVIGAVLLSVMMPMAGIISSIL